MPTRILRDWTDSEPVNALSVHAERLFVRLIMKADDYGRLTANPKLLRPLLFPLTLDEVRETDLQRWIAECEIAGLVRLYGTETKPLLAIERFNQRTRTDSKLPAPPESCPSFDGQVTAQTETKAEAEAETKARRTPQPPFPFDSPRFAEVWGRWKVFRGEIGKKLTPSMVQGQFKMLAKLGESGAVEAIETSIANGWTGLFPPKPNGRGGYRSKAEVIVDEVAEQLESITGDPP